MLSVPAPPVMTSLPLVPMIMLSRALPTRFREPVPDVT